MTIRRNDLCHCGSGKKYKHCCRRKDIEEAKQAQKEAKLVREQSSSLTLDPFDEEEEEQFEPFANSSLPVVEEEDEGIPEDVEALNQLYEEFEDADYEEQIVICRRAIEERALDSELAFEFFNTIYYESVEREERARFDELATALRQHQPDIYQEEANYIREWRITNALVANRMEEVQTLVNEAFKEGGEDLDAFGKILDQLEYHGLLNVLVIAAHQAWPEVTPGKYFPDTQEEFDGRLTDYLVQDYLERTPHEEVTSPERFDALLAEITSRITVERDDFARYLIRATDQSEHAWSITDFTFDEVDSAHENLHYLSHEFLGHLRWKEGVPYPKANMGRTHIMRYILQRHEGELKPASIQPKRTRLRVKRGKRRKRNQTQQKQHPLVPDYGTLDRYLGGLLSFLVNRTYEAAAALELIPAWLRFLESRNLIDAEERQHTLDNLKGLDTSLTKVWQQHRSDP